MGVNYSLFESVGHDIDKRKHIKLAPKAVNMCWAHLAAIASLPALLPLTTLTKTPPFFSNNKNKIK